MNFAVPFGRDFHYLDADNIQLNILYKRKVKELDFFINQYQNKRINIEISSIEPQDLEIIKTLKEKYSEANIILAYPYYTKKIEMVLNEQKIPHYYKTICNTWNLYNGFLSLNVTDIFVGEDIMFDILAVSLKAKKAGVRLRTYCNLCQNSWYQTDVTNFFIRPEDIKLYNNFIDTFEFCYKNEIHKIHQANVYYKAYALTQEWFGKLKEIIVNYNEDDDNRCFSSSFGKKRFNCGAICRQEKCHICNMFQDLARTLQKKDKIFISSLEK